MRTCGELLQKCLRNFNLESEERGSLTESCDTFMYQGDATMLRHVRRIINTLNNLFETSRASQRESRRSVRLCVEQLEDRVLLATLIWICRDDSGLRKKETNWFNKDTGRVAIAAPAKDDTLEFDSTWKSADGTISGGAKASVDNIAGLSLAELNIKNYTGRITLQQDLMVGLLDMNGGTIGGNKNLTIMTSAAQQGKDKEKMYR